MTDGFDKVLSNSEIRWSFIRVPRKFLSLFPMNKPFKIICHNRSFVVSVNKAQRIVSKELFRELMPKEGSIIHFSKEADNEFTVKIL